LTTLQRDDVIGAQRPRVESSPKAARTSGDDAVELAGIAGLDLDPWQQHVLRVALGERPDGKWSALEVGLIVPRQNGKGSVLEARELAGLFLFGERTIIHSAHEMKTAVEAFLRIRDLCKNTPELDEQVRAYYQSNEKTAIELKNGQRLRFMARSDGSGRGFTGDTIILDEAYNLPHATLRAIFSTMSAKSINGNPQLWYTSSAGMENSEVLAQVRERGIKGDKRLAFLEWSAPDDSDLDDRTAWALANPGLNIRISEEFVESERGALGRRGFRAGAAGHLARPAHRLGHRPERLARHHRRRLEGGRPGRLRRGRVAAAGPGVHRHRRPPRGRPVPRRGHQEPARHRLDRGRARATERGVVAGRHHVVRQVDPGRTAGARTSPRSTSAPRTWRARAGCSTTARSRSAWSTSTSRS
jgi:hypothetical protein